MSNPRKRGDTFSRQFEIRDAAGNAVDLSNYTGRCQMRLESARRVTDDSPAVTLTVVMTNPPSGIVTITAPAIETVDWTPGRYIGDIEFTLGDQVFSTVDFIQDIVPDRTL